jgi:hypothetical protein
LGRQQVEHKGAIIFMEKIGSSDLLHLLKKEAVNRGHLNPRSSLGLEQVYYLVRDMPYKRASSRDPETIIREWQGTCSGKHYLLKALFSELGYDSRVIACSTISLIDPAEVPEEMRALIDEAGGRFVDIHNYLILEYPGGEMVVDATWPVDTKAKGLKVNESFVLGEDMVIAADPIDTWVVPEDRNPQEFKNELLANNFTPDELHYRDLIIQALSRLLAGA